VNIDLALGMFTTSMTRDSTAKFVFVGYSSKTPRIMVFSGVILPAYSPSFEGGMYAVMLRPIKFFLWRGW